MRATTVQSSAVPATSSQPSSASLTDPRHGARRASSAFICRDHNALVRKHLEIDQLPPCRSRRAVLPPSKRNSPACVHGGSTRRACSPRRRGNVGAYIDMTRSRIVGVQAAPPLGRCRQSCQVAVSRLMRTRLRFRCGERCRNRRQAQCRAQTGQRRSTEERAAGDSRQRVSVFAGTSGRDAHRRAPIGG